MRPTATRAPDAERTVFCVLAVASLQTTGKTAKKVQTVHRQRQFTTDQENLAADFAADAAKAVSVHNHGL